MRDTIIIHNIHDKASREFVSGDKPTIPVLEKNICTYFPDYNLSIRDTTRFRMWERDFDSLLALNKVPQFNTAPQLHMKLYV